MIGLSNSTLMQSMYFTIYERYVVTVHKLHSTMCFLNVPMSDVAAPMREQ